MSEVAERRSAHPDETGTPPVERVGAVWYVRSAALAREVLRAAGTTQAGFLAEAGARPGVRPPILWAHGEAHRRQRSLTARYFAPRTVDTRYRPLMESYADEIVAALLDQGGGRLDELSRLYAVRVAAQVIGLTESRPAGMAARLDRLFEHPGWDPAVENGGRGRLTRLLARVSAVAPVLRFLAADVAPAIRARRGRPREDVISHLIAQGCSRDEILIECITYGAAGMVTTREFITMATWHLLDAPDLRARYLEAPEPERMAILAEILRLEPVVGHLLRRVAEPFEVAHKGARVAFQAGDLVDLCIRPTNADPTVVGQDPERLCPARSLPRGYKPEMLSFGDGPHRCPGGSMALQETDILLRRLLVHDVASVHPPQLSWDEVVHGYQLRGLDLSVRRGRQVR